MRRWSFTTLLAALVLALSAHAQDAAVAPATGAPAAPAPEPAVAPVAAMPPAVAGGPVAGTTEADPPPSREELAAIREQLDQVQDALEESQTANQRIFVLVFLAIIILIANIILQTRRK